MNGALGTGMTLYGLSVPLGDPKTRFRIAEKFSVAGVKFASIVHPDVRVPSSVRIGAGTIVMAGTQFTQT